MKRKGLLILGVVCCLAGAACGNDKTNNTSTTPQPTTAPTQELQIEVGGITNFPLPSPAPTKAPEPTPILRCVTKNEEIKVEEDGKVILMSQISYPVFDGVGAEGLNQKVSEMVENFRADFAEQEKYARSDYAGSKKNGVEFETQEDDFFVTISGKTEELMSMISVRYTNAGGPHPNFYQLGHVYKISDGSVCSLEDYLKGKQLTVKNIAERASEDFMKQAENDPDAFMLSRPLSEEVLDLINKEHWYFSENGVVVFINPYEIAPYAMGSFMSVIPVE